MCAWWNAVKDRGAHRCEDATKRQVATQPAAVQAVKRRQQLMPSLLAVVSVVATATCAAAGHTLSHFEPGKNLFRVFWTVSHLATIDGDDLCIESRQAMARTHVRCHIA